VEREEESRKIRGAGGLPRPSLRVPVPVCGRHSCGFKPLPSRSRIAYIYRCRGERMMRRGGAGYRQDGLLTSSISLPPLPSLPTSTSFQSLSAVLGLVGRLLSRMEKVRERIARNPKKKKQATLVTMDGRAMEEEAAATPRSRALRRSEIAANCTTVAPTHLHIFAKSTSPPASLAAEEDAQSRDRDAFDAGEAASLLLRRGLDERLDKALDDPTRLEIGQTLPGPLATDKGSWCENASTAKGCRHRHSAEAKSTKGLILCHRQNQARRLIRSKGNAARTHSRKGSTGHGTTEDTEP
jgi:hypothetical protein